MRNLVGMLDKVWKFLLDWTPDLDEAVQRAKQEAKQGEIEAIRHGMTSVERMQYNRVVNGIRSTRGY